MDAHFFGGGIAPIECYESSNWKKLKRFAPKKSKNDLVDGSGAHFKVGDASRSGDRAPAKAAKANPKWHFLQRKNPKWHFFGREKVS